MLVVLQVSDLTEVGDVLWVSGVLQVSYMPRLSNATYASDGANNHRLYYINITNACSV